MPKGMTFTEEFLLDQLEKYYVQVGEFPEADHNRHWLPVTLTRAERIGVNLPAVRTIQDKFSGYRKAQRIVLERIQTKEKKVAAQTPVLTTEEFCSIFDIPQTQSEIQQEIPVVEAELMPPEETQVDSEKTKAEQLSMQEVKQLATEVSQECDMLKQEKALLEQTIDTLEAKAANNQERIAELEASFDRFATKDLQQAQEIKTLKETNHNLVTQVMSFEKSNDSLRTELSNREGEIKKLIETKEQLRKALDDQTEKAEAQYDLNQELVHQHRIYQDKIAELQLQQKSQEDERTQRLWAYKNKLITQIAEQVEAIDSTTVDGMLLIDLINLLIQAEDNW